MPAEIVQTKGHIAEVRLTCDQCKENIGTQLMHKREAEKLTKTQVLCQNCHQAH